MNKLFKSKKLMEELFLIFLSLHPIIDLITSIMTRFIDFPISLGIVIRGLFILFLFIFLIFENKSKYKKYTNIFLISYIIFAILYFACKPELFNRQFLITEVIYFFKYSYFPLSFVGILNFVDHYKIKFDKINSIIVLNYIEVVSSIIIAEVTHTSFLTYNDKSIKGSMGWFFSGNEISSYITILCPYLCMFFNNKRQKRYYAFIIMSIIVSLMIGTKTSFLGALLPLILFLIYFIIKLDKKMILFYISFIAIFILSCNSTAVMYNFTNQNKLYNNIENNNIKVDKNETNKDKNETNKDKNENNINSSTVTTILNNRNFYAKEINKMYVKAPFVEKLTGIGFVNRKSINNKFIIKLIEMDPLDIFYRYGILGFIILCSPFICFMYIAIKKLFKNKLFMHMNFLTLCYIVCISALVSLTAGHVLGAPMVSIYISIVIARLYQEKYI